MGCFSSNEKEKKVFDIDVEPDDYDLKKRQELNSSKND